MNQVKMLKDENGEINKESIKRIIPYDDPFLFLDRVLNISSNRIIAVKDITGREDFLKGHFVDFPIMPGALTVEGMGQAASFLVRSNITNHREKDILAYKLKEVKFTAPIIPPAQVKFEVELIAQDERGAILRGKALVNENTVAEALLMLAIVNKSEFRTSYSK